MAVSISPGILAVVVILAVELVVIIAVISYLLWKTHGKSPNKSDVPKEGNYNDKAVSEQSVLDQEDTYITENEEEDQKPTPAPRNISNASLSMEEDEKCSLSSTSSSSNAASPESEDEKEQRAEECSNKEAEFSDKEEPEEPIVPVVKETVQLQNVKPEDDSPQLSSSTSTNSLASSSSSKELEEEQLPITTDGHDENSTDEEEEDAEEEEQEPDQVKIIEEKKKEDLVQSEPEIPTVIEIPSSPSPVNVKSIDLGGITLSLRIEPGNDNSSPTVHVNGKTIESNKSDQSSSSSSEGELEVKTSNEQNNKGIEVIRRYESPHRPIVYDPTQKKMIEDVHMSGTFAPSLEEENNFASGEFVGEEEAVAGIINVTTGEKLTICQAVTHGLIPKKTGLLLLEAQAATGSVVNPRNGVKLSVSDAVTLGIVDEEYKQTLIAAEGAYYGFMDPRTGDNVSLSTAMSREIFPRLQGVRLLEAQAATGGIIDPWTGLRYPLNSALSKGLIDRETANLLKNPEEQTEFFDPTTQKRLGYGDLLNKCIRDLDTGMKFLYIEEKPKTTENRYQPDLLTFRSAFRRKVTLQDLIDAGLVERPILEAFQSGRINKEELRDLLQPFLVGTEPIAGILNTTTRKVFSICQAVREGLLRRGTALELLEAQAATGSIIDPISGKRMSVSRAVSIGLVESAYSSSLRRAEQAVHGYTEPGTNRMISLFEAMSRGVVIESHGIRMLEAQVATGGVIDSQAGYRIPAQVALQRGLFDQRMAEILMGTNHDMKGYYDPNTGDNVTYGELMKRCVRNKKKYGNMLLLPIKDKAPMAASMQQGPYRHRTVVIMDPSTKKKLTIDQALSANIIDHDTAKNLTQQQGSWTHT